jgi:hypothetical protein
MVLATIQSFFTTLKSPSQEFFFLEERRRDLKPFGHFSSELKINGKVANV